MNKYNLYNLSQQRQTVVRATYFQQKWFAKRATRAYHGEQIREKKWQRMFTSRIKSVVPMNYRYLAFYDGSEQAAGRGSGLQTSENPLDDKGLRMRRNKVIPYMGMTYAPAERRLDTAVFRALFASSARQARQFVLHGGVKVNGKKVWARNFHKPITRLTIASDDLPRIPPQPRRYVPSRARPRPFRYRRS